MSVPEKFIDIKEVIRKKNPALAKMMPGFAVYLTNQRHTIFGQKLFEKKFIRCDKKR